MDVQYIIVVFIVVGAMAYIGRTIYKSATGSPCEAGNCGCEKKSLKKV
jgi:hypothetical protein